MFCCEQHLQDLKVPTSKLLKRISGSFLEELSLVISDDTNQICQFQVTSQILKQTAVHQNDDQTHTFLHGFTTEVYVIMGIRALGLPFVFLGRWQLAPDWTPGAEWEIKCVSVCVRVHTSSTGKG